MVDALLTSTSSGPPNAFSVVAIKRSMSFGLLTLASIASTLASAEILRTSSRTLRMASPCRAASERPAAPARVPIPATRP